MIILSNLLNIINNIVSHSKTHNCNIKDQHLVCTYCYQSERQIDGPNTQCEIFGLVKLGLKHFGGIVDYLEEKHRNLV